MPLSIEAAIDAHVRAMTPTSLRGLYEALLGGGLLVSAFDESTRDTRGHTDVHMNCVRLPTGEGCLPAFTSVDRFLEWKPVGSMYVELPGRKLFEMARGMPEIECVYVNFSERAGTPKGRVVRAEFELLAQGILPGSG